MCLVYFFFIFFLENLPKKVNKFFEKTHIYVNLKANQ